MIGRAVLYGSLLSSCGKFLQQRSVPVVPNSEGMKAPTVCKDKTARRSPTAAREKKKLSEKRRPVIIASCQRSSAFDFDARGCYTRWRTVDFRF